MKNLKFKTVLRSLAGIAILGLLTFLFFFSRTSWIPVGHVGVVYDASRGLLPSVYRPQAVFIGWRQKLYVYPTRLQNAVYTKDESAGEIRAADPILITTNDNANTEFDVSVVYRVKPEDVIGVFNEFGARPIEEIQATFIRRAVKEAANSVGTQYDLFSLMGPKRLEASEKITAQLQRILQPVGISVERAMLCTCYPTQEFQSKITSRVNSYVELEISRLKREIAEIERQVAVVKGEANQQATALSASEAKERSLDLLKLEAAEKALEKWDGQLPLISPKQGQNVIITPEVLNQLQSQQAPQTQPGGRRR
jgi:regulator of protease activity HflC (stomatin/prohibitin superfamily)